MLSCDEKDLITDYGKNLNWKVSFTANHLAEIILPGDGKITIDNDNGAYILCGKDEIFRNFPIGMIKLDKEKYKVGIVLIDVLEKIAQSETANPPGKNDTELLAAYWNDISQLEEAERNQWTKSRVGQDKLRDFLLKRHVGCQITGITRKELLIASHIKPWRDCTDKINEGLDPENILLLAKNYDAFFDAALISFSPENGTMIVSCCVTENDLKSMGIDRNAKLPKPSPRQAEYLKYHNELLKKS